METWSAFPFSFLLGRGEFLFLGEGLEEGAQFSAVFGQHPDELHAVADLRVRSDHLGLDEQGVLELQSKVEGGADGKWIHAVDVAAAEAEVGGSAPNGGVAAFGVNFDGHAHRESRVLTPLR